MTGVVGLMMAMMAMMTTAAFVPSTSTAVKSFANWEHARTYHLRVLHRLTSPEGGKEAEVCVVLAARYGQTHRDLRPDPHHVLFFPYLPNTFFI